MSLRNYLNKQLGFAIPEDAVQQLKHGITAKINHANDIRRSLPPIHEMISEICERTEKYQAESKALRKYQTKDLNEYMNVYSLDEKEKLNEDSKS